jgi:Uma2 family endonuclease
MSTVGQARATLDDLYATPGKAELIGGRILELMPAADAPNVVAANIYVSLREYAKKTGQGKAYTDDIGFAVAELPSGRESFSPDAAYYAGPRPANRMRFVQGSPTFAVEVRSENDYGDAAGAAMAEKRADYFLAGTIVVWDVDPVNERVAVYRAGQADQPAVFQRGQEADAEPAVPGWRLRVDQVVEE